MPAALYRSRWRRTALVVRRRIDIRMRTNVLIRHNVELPYRLPRLLMSASHGVHSVAVCSLLVSVLATSFSATAQAVEPEWLTGPALEKRLSTPLSVSRSSLTLRQKLANLSRVQQFAVLIDRRIDPDQAVDVNLNDVALREGLARIAAACDAAVCQFGPVTYVGPPDAVDRLRTLAALRREDVGQLAASASSRQMAAMRPWQWNDFATPRELLRRLADEAAIEIREADRIPHDLWAAGDLPPLRWADRMTLLLVQFDLTFSIEPSSGGIVLEPIPDDVFIERNYEATPRPEEQIARWTQRAPDAEIRMRGDRILVRGRLEDHERLRAVETSQEPISPAPAVEVYSLTFRELRLESVLGQLASKLGLRLEFDREAIRTAGLSTDHRVSVDAHNVSIEELLDAIVDGTGLICEREKGVLRIVPADSP